MSIYKAYNLQYWEIGDHIIVNKAGIAYFTRMNCADWLPLLKQPQLVCINHSGVEPCAIYPKGDSKSWFSPVKIYFDRCIIFEDEYV